MIHFLLHISATLFRDIAAHPHLFAIMVYKTVLSSTPLLVWELPLSTTLSQLRETVLWD